MVFPPVARQDLADSTFRTNASDAPVWAAIDLGTHSFRMELARLVDGRLRSVALHKEAVRLGDGAQDPDGLVIHEAALLRAEHCLMAFANVISQQRVLAGVRAVATEGIRKAQDQRAIVARLEHALGHPIKVLDASTEGRISYEAVAGGITLPLVDAIVVDVGGGSTQVMWGHGTAWQRTSHVSLGCIEVVRRWVKPLVERGMTVSAALATAEVTVRQHLSNAWSQPTLANTAAPSTNVARPPVRVLATSGIASTVVDLIHAHRGQRVQAITADDLHWFLDRCAQASSWSAWMSEGLQGLAANRRDTLVGGCLMLLAVIQHLDVRAIEATPYSLHHGLLWNCMHDHAVTAAP